MIVGYNENTLFGMVDGYSVELAFMGSKYGFRISEYDFWMNTNIRDITEWRVVFTLRVVWIHHTWIKEIGHSKINWIN